VTTSLEIAITFTEDEAKALADYLTGQYKTHHRGPLGEALAKITEALNQLDEEYKPNG
jgi:hypothetical protein